MHQSRQLSKPAWGFTLIEVLVALGIITLLIALTMPAAQHAREAARRTQCRNNLKEIGVAVHQYAEVHGCLPMGRIPIHDARFAGPNPPCTAVYNDKSFLVAILPYAEQSQLYNAVNHSLSIFALENTTTHTRGIEMFACPSDLGAGLPASLVAGQLSPMAPDPPGGPWQIVMTSYSGSFGSFAIRALPGFFSDCTVPSQLIAQSNGCFNDLHPIRLASIVDGLSTTTFVSEKAVATFADADGVPIVRAQEKNCKFVSGDLGDTLFTAFYPPNASKKMAIGAVGARLHSASSLHPGGINVLMGDGSVRFINDSIDSWPLDPLTGQPIGAVQNSNGWWENVPAPGVWQALSTRSGSEAIDSQF